MTTESGISGITHTSHQHRALLSRICDPITGVPVNYQKKNRVLKIRKQFIGKDLHQWLLENTKANNRKSALDIIYSFVSAGIIICEEGQIGDDEACYKVVKELRDDLKSLYRYSKTGPRVSQTKTKGNFGSDLDELLQRDQSDIPQFLVSMINYLDIEENINTEGLFRITASSTELNRIKDFVNYHEGPLNFENFNFKNPHIVTSLLKTWLRQIPIPLVHPFENFAPLAEQVITHKRISLCRTFIEQLPRGYAMSLDYLIGFLHRVSSHSDKNKMGYSNLAAVVGPNILRRLSPSPLTLLKDVSDANSIVALLISEYASIFNHIDFMNNYKISLLQLPADTPRTSLNSSSLRLLDTNSNTKEDHRRSDKISRKASFLREVPKLIEKRPDILQTTYEGIKISEILTQMLSVNGVKFKSRKHNLRSVKRVASGCNLVEWLSKKYGWKKEKCNEFLQKIIDAGYIQSTPSTSSFKESSLYLFSFEELIPEEKENAITVKISLDKVSHTESLPSPTSLLSPFNSPSLTPRETEQIIDAYDTITHLSKPSIPNLPLPPLEQRKEILERENSKNSITSPRLTSTSNPAKKVELAMDKHNFRTSDKRKPRNEKNNEKPVVAAPVTARSHVTRVDRGKSEGILTKRNKLLVNESSAREMMPLNFESHEAEFREALAKLSLKDGGWILLGYEDMTTLCIQETCETDSIPDLANNLRDNEVQYIVLRLSQEEKGDHRYVFITWIGRDVNLVEKARKKIHAGKVAKLFKTPFHAELSAISKQNFSRERIIHVMEQTHMNNNTNTPFNSTMI